MIHSPTDRPPGTALGTNTRELGTHLPEGPGISQLGKRFYAGDLPKHNFGNFRWFPVTLACPPRQAPSLLRRCFRCCDSEFTERLSSPQYRLHFTAGAEQSSIESPAHQIFAADAEWRTIEETDSPDHRCRRTGSPISTTVMSMATFTFTLDDIVPDTWQDEHIRFLFAVNVVRFPSDGKARCGS